MFYKPLYMCVTKKTHNYNTSFWKCCTRYFLLLFFFLLFGKFVLHQRYFVNIYNMEGFFNVISGYNVHYLKAVIE